MNDPRSSTSMRCGPARAAAAPACGVPRLRTLQLAAVLFFFA
jgi:hypothetical protein